MGGEVEGRGRGERNGGSRKGGGRGLRGMVRTDDGRGEVGGS